MHAPHDDITKQDHRLTLSTLYASPKGSANDVFNQTFTVNPYSTLPSRFNTTLKAGQTLKNSQYLLKLK